MYKHCVVFFVFMLSVNLINLTKQIKSIYIWINWL